MIRAITKAEIADTIRNAVNDVTGLTNFSDDDSLIDRDLGVFPADFLYIFDILEKKLALPVYDIFTYSKYDVMTVSNLATEIYKLEQN